MARKPSKTRGASVSIARRALAQGKLMCECGAGPFRGQIGLTTHIGRTHSDQRSPGIPCEDGILRVNVDYRQIFIDHHGDGPHACCFCEIITSEFIVHHLDEDRLNNDIENLASAHVSCHTAHHTRGRPSASEETRRKIGKASTALIRTDAHKKAIGDALRGRSKSAEHRDKISKTLRGRKKVIS